MDTNEHSIAEARANLSEVLSAVRLRRETHFLYSRSKGQAAVVPFDLGQLIEEAGGPDAVADLLKSRKEGRRG
ncbi:prevent-host-death family protein [Streptomyces cellulosae]